MLESLLVGIPLKASHDGRHLYTDQCEHETINAGLYFGRKLPALMNSTLRASLILLSAACGRNQT